MRIKKLLVILLLLSCSRSGSKGTLKPGETWSGVYLAQKKIGYSVFKSQILPDGYKFINRAKMRLKMMEIESEINSTFSCNTDTGLGLKSFDMDFVSQQRSFNAQGKITDSKLAITIRSAGETKSKVLAVPQKLYPASILSRVVAFQGIAPGKEYKLKVFEPTILDIAEAQIKIEKREKIKIKNREYEAWKLQLAMLGLATTMWIDSSGETIKEESPPGIVMIVETPQEALALESGSALLDVLSLFSIRVDSLITDPRNLSYLKIKMKNIDTTDLSLSDESQKIVSVDPLVLEIKGSVLPKKGMALPIAGPTEFLKPSLCIQSDNPKIKAKALAITQGSKDGVEATGKILNWVNQNVKKRATASLPSAVDVLANLEGDCNEHSVLFAALARAAGIPTKIAVGIVYLDNAFYYHAWNKVYLGEWVSLDPTFGQFPADATHIKIQEGELAEQAKVLKIVGNLKIDIVEFK